MIKITNIQDSNNNDIQDSNNNDIINNRPIGQLIRNKEDLYINFEMSKKDAKDAYLVYQMKVGEITLDDFILITLDEQLSKNYKINKNISIIEKDEVYLITGVASCNI